MTFRIRDAIPTRAERRVGRFLQDPRACRGRTLKVGIDAANVEKPALCGLTQARRIAVGRRRTAHHDHVAPDLHRRVVDFSVGPS